MVSPSGRMPEWAPDWFFMATEACGGGTSDLWLFLGVYEYIGFLGVGFTRRWATRGPQDTRVRQRGLARPSGLWPPRGSSGPLTKILVPLLFQKNHQKVSGDSENFHFLHKNNTTVVLLKTALVRVSSNQIIPKPYKIVINMA